MVRFSQIKTKSHCFVRVCFVPKTCLNFYHIKANVLFNRISSMNTSIATWNYTDFRCKFNSQLNITFAPYFQVSLMINVHVGRGKTWHSSPTQLWVQEICKTSQWRNRIINTYLFKHTIMAPQRILLNLC